ncbi:(d)CMP kinase [Thermotoga sp. KOL6]|uniref:(d)CMP kinase n=1 Tax=Thermotoga sp. KOL6 TaxID=126741 RepID=UPI000C77C4F6|nr:(d)CMP kinase [Thermotoga sp. KOL6]PLV60173.1 cytidylate kinase [Thermotoga sp. KOL6]
MGFQIAIDGPAASGKSTIAKLLAMRLGFEHLNTGATYRAVAVYLKEKGLTPSSSQKKLEELLRNLKVDYKNGRVFVNGVDYTEKIQSPEAGILASSFAKLEVVRKHLVRIQREICDDKNIVVEGRDIGTVVLPKAALKIFLTASLDARVERKLKEYRKRGLNVKREEVERELIARDEQDSKRSVAPLKPAEDAVIIDTTDMTVEEVLQKIQKLVEERMKS